MGARDVYEGGGVQVLGDRASLHAEARRYRDRGDHTSADHVDAMLERHPEPADVVCAGIGCSGCGWTGHQAERS